MSKNSFKLDTIQNKSRSRKLKVLFLIAAVVTGVAAFMLYNNWTTDRQADKQKARDTAQIETAKTNVSNSTKGDQQDSANLPDNSRSITSGQVANSTRFSISIMNIEQAGGAVAADAKIIGTDESATCVFTFSANESKPVVRQVTSSGNTCSASVPEVEFTKTGMWNLNVTFYADNEKAEASQSVEIN